jgi:ribosomal protein S18 acetylase RimI-like enzyme
VAVPWVDSDDVDQLQEDRPSIVGVVDLIVLQKEEVLNFLDGATEYLYLSGMAVHNEYKRQGIGLLLLQAAETKARSLGFRFVVLQVYVENKAAQALYEKAGYRAVHTSSAWSLETFLPGTQGKRRVLMIKPSGLVEELNERFDQQ